ERCELRGARAHGRRLGRRLRLSYRRAAPRHHAPSALRQDRHTLAPAAGGNARAATTQADRGDAARLHRRPRAGGARAPAEARAESWKIARPNTLVAARGEAVAKAPSISRPRRPSVLRCRRRYPRAPTSNAWKRAALTCRNRFVDGETDEESEASEKTEESKESEAGKETEDNGPRSGLRCACPA